MQKCVLSRKESMCRGGSDPKHHGGLEGTAGNSVCLAQGACMRRDWGHRQNEPVKVFVSLVRSWYLVISLAGVANHCKMVRKEVTSSCVIYQDDSDISEKND